MPTPLLRTAAQGRVPHPADLRYALRVAAIVVLSVAAGGIGGWLLRDATRESLTWSDFAREAAVAHLVCAPELQRPVEVLADREEQLLAWLSRQVGAAIEAPQLVEVG